MPRDDGMPGTELPTYCHAQRSPSCARQLSGPPWDGRGDVRHVLCRACRVHDELAGSRPLAPAQERLALAVLGVLGFSVLGLIAWTVRLLWQETAR